MAVSKLTAVLGTCRRKGRWEVSKNTSALIVFGRCHVDYRDASADPELERITIKVFCLFGAVTMIMRAGTDVRPSVVSLLASSRCDVEGGDREDETSFPAVVLEVTTLFGRCRVVSSPEEVEETEAEVEQRRVTDTVEPNPSSEGVGLTSAPAAPTVAASADPRSPVSLLGATVASLSTTSSALPEDSQPSFHDPVLPMRTAKTPPPTPTVPAAPPPTPGGSFDDQARSAVESESNEASVSELAFVNQLETPVATPNEAERGQEPAADPSVDGGTADGAQQRLSELDPAKAVDLAAGPTIRVSAS